MLWDHEPTGSQPADLMHACVKPSPHERRKYKYKAKKASALVGTAGYNQMHNNIKTLRSSHARGDGRVEVVPTSA